MNLIAKNKDIFQLTLCTWTFSFEVDLISQEVMFQYKTVFKIPTRVATRRSLLWIVELCPLAPSQLPSKERSQKLTLIETKYLRMEICRRQHLKILE